MNTRSPRQTLAETGRVVKVTLAYRTTSLGSPYQVVKIVNEVAVVVTKDNRPVTLHVNDFLTEEQATDLLTEPGLEVTTVPAK